MARILVVDDEEKMQALLAKSLERQGHELRRASDGVAAVAILEEFPADVVFSDLRMPGLDGMDVLKTIKNRWPECEVVVITGYPTLETAKEAVRLGAQNYLAKPVGPDDVIRAASEAMTHKRWAIHSESTLTH